MAAIRYGHLSIETPLARLGINGSKVVYITLYTHYMGEYPPYGALPIDKFLVEGDLTKEEKLNVERVIEGVGFVEQFKNSVVWA